MKHAILILSLLPALLAAEQEGAASDISLYVVTAVVLITWAGIALYLYHLDRKTERIRQNLEQG